MLPVVSVEDGTACLVPLGNPASRLFGMLTR